MTQYWWHPDMARLRAQALELAVRSWPGEVHNHMTSIANRAHYFAHYITDSNRNIACEDRDCPYREPMVPAQPDTLTS
jgi:hypothetical protein